MPPGVSLPAFPDRRSIPQRRASRSFLIEMVTLAGLEPATSPAPGEQGRSIPLELQRRHDLHDRLWRRRGIGHDGQALAYVYFEDIGSIQGN